MVSQIREIRNRLGLSQKDLARRADICQSLLCAIEKERLKPGRSVITKIARALKVSETELFHKEKDSAESLAAPAESSRQSTNGGESTHGN